MTTTRTTNDTTTSTTAASTVITVIHCWSAPRSRSTALLYSFEARARAASNDNTAPTPTIALDEPLYREWLLRRGEAVARPYREALIAGQAPSDGDDINTDDEATRKRRWGRELMSWNERLHDAAKRLLVNNKATNNNGVIFCKHMAKHSFLYDFENELKSLSSSSSSNHDDDDDDDNNNDKNTPTFQLVHKHVLLIRDPVAILSSWNVSGDVHGNSATPDEVGIIPMLSILSALESQSRRPASSSSSSSSSSSTTKNVVTVLDSDELVRDPEAVLSSLCETLGIVYTDAMMTWPAGPHECDGPWAPWWYQNVRQSTGWQQKNKKKPTIPHLLL